MRFSELKQKKWFRFVSNKYVLIFLLFIIWMLFFDTNSYFIHNELNNDIKSLENNKDFYHEEIKNDKKFIEKMKDSSEIERFAREKYYLKKDNEDIYLIEHEDSVKTKNTND